MLPLNASSPPLRRHIGIQTGESLQLETNMTKSYWLFSATALSWLSSLPGCQKTVPSAKGYVKTWTNAIMKATSFIPVAATTYATVKNLCSHGLKKVQHSFLPRKLFLWPWINLFAKWFSLKKHFLVWRWFVVCFFFNETLSQNLGRQGDWAQQNQQTWEHLFEVTRVHFKPKLLTEPALEKALAQRGW